MERIAIALVLLAGCAHSVPERSTLVLHNDGDVLQVLASMWRAAGLEWSDRCDDELATARVAIHPEDDFRFWTTLCGYIEGADGEEVCPVSRPCRRGCARAAMTYVQTSAWPASMWSFGTPVFHIHENRAQYRRALVIHEALHWLGSCSGRGPDRKHLDEERWTVGAAMP